MQYLRIFILSPSPNPSSPHPPPPPKGDWGCLMSLSCVESQGCHWVPLSYLLSCFSASSSLSFCLALFQLMVQSPDVFQDILQYLSLTLSIKKQTFFVWLLLSRFEMTAGWRHMQLAGGMWHWHLPLCIHVYNYILDIISFFCCCYCSLKTKQKQTILWSNSNKSHRMVDDTNLSHAYRFIKENIRFKNYFLTRAVLKGQTCWECVCVCVCVCVCMVLILLCFLYALIS